MDILQWTGEVVAFLILIAGAFIFGVVIGDVKHEISDMNEDKR